MAENLTAKTIKPDALTGFLRSHSWAFLGQFIDSAYSKLDWADVADSLRWMSRFDGQIRGHLEIRKSRALSAYSWDLSGGSEKSRELVRKNLKSLAVNGSLGRLWSAVPFGLSLCEINWKNDGRNWSIEELKEIPFESVRFDQDRNPLLLADDWAQLWLPSYKRKYVLFQYDSDDNNPYGMPLLASVYWVQKAKKAGVRLWVKLMDRFSVPELLAICDSSGNQSVLEAQLKAVTSQLLSLRDGGGGAVANVKDIKELSVNGQGDDFEKFFKFLKDEISFAILGSNLTTSEGSAGSRALGEVHASTSEALYQADAREIAKVLNEQVIRYLVDVNFGIDEEKPVFSWDFDGSASWEQVTKAVELGIPVSKRGFYDRFRLPEPTDKADSFVSENSGKANPAGGAALSDRPFPGCGCQHPGTQLKPKKPESNGWIGSLIK